MSEVNNRLLSPEEAEPRSEPNTYERAIDATANNPAKMLTLLVLAEQPSTYFTRTSLMRTLMEKQGAQPGWVPGASVPFGYCRNSLEPIGMLAKGKVPSVVQWRGDVEAMNITPLGLEVGVPLAACMLEWELAYPDLSLQKVLGATNSSTGREARTPSVRMMAYERLLSSSVPLSFTDLGTLLGEDVRRMEGFVHNMRDGGIVEVTEKFDLETRILRLSQPTWENIASRDDIRPETDAIYAVVNDLIAEGVHEISARRFLEEVARHRIA